MINHNEQSSISEGQEIYDMLAEAVVEMDEEQVLELTDKVISKEMDAFEAIDKGLSRGMEKAGALFEEEEYFVPELLMCADAMNLGVDKLKPYIKINHSMDKVKIVIGVIQGDTHDIGKNLVKLMLENAGFDVIDLGRDISPIEFIQSAEQSHAEIIMVSSLMTTTMEGMKEIITLLEEKGIRNQYKVCIGGGPVSQNYADKIGADGYSKNAADAVRLCQSLIQIEERELVGI